MSFPNHRTLKLVSKLLEQEITVVGPEGSDGIGELTNIVAGARKADNNMKVLLVDDSTTMRRIQRNQLGALGITDVVEAENGEHALSQLEANMPVDLVLLDWNMPVMDGLSVLKKVRGDAKYKGVKIIMCTSESEKVRVLEALKAGANDYMVKPFAPEALKKKLAL